MATVSLKPSALASSGAVAYACTRLGFRVFPLSRGTGTPALARWQVVATTDAAQVRQWWTGDFAGHGVGIATGPDSGVWVLDIDVKDGAGGFASLHDLCARHQTSAEALGTTLIVQTPSGGAHLYFQWDAASGADGGVRNSAKAIAPGIDVRGLGGYVRAPGVGAYRIVARSADAPLRVTAAPAWLTAMCKKRADHASLRDRTAAKTARGQRGSEQVRERVDHVRSMLGAAPSGARNIELNRAAFRLGILGRFGGVSREAAWELCRGVMRDIEAGDSVEAQARTFASGWNAGLASLDGDGERR